MTVPLVPLSVNVGLPKNVAWQGKGPWPPCDVLARGVREPPPPPIGGQGSLTADCTDSGRDHARVAPARRR
jgi:hypothetical protein